MSDSTMRITGLASGLDTESIITVLVAARKVPIDTLTKKVATENQQLAAYTKIQTLANDLESAAYTLSTSSTWNGKTTSSTNTDVATAKATSSASNGTYKLVVSTLASAESVRGTTQSSGTTYSAGSFTLNGQTVTVSEGASLSDVVSAINTASSNMDSGKKVTASIINNTLVIENQTAGSSNAMTFSEDEDGTLLSSLGLSSDHGTTLKDSTAGTNFKGYVNGVLVTGTSNTLSSVVTGVTFTANDVGSSTITIASDSSKIEDAVNDFLDAYNAINDYISTNTAVTTNSSGEAQSAGILQGQFYPTNLETKLFQYMSSVITGSSEISTSYNSLYKIGITRDDDTGDYSISDTDKFNSALSSNFEDVQNLFMGGDSNGYYGIAKTMDTYLKKGVLSKLDGSLPAIIDQMNTTISNDENKIDDLNTRLVSYETNLYVHYSSMENMVESWNSQLQYLLSNLGISSS